MIRTTLVVSVLLLAMRGCDRRHPYTITIENETGHMIESAEVTFADSGYSLTYGYIPSAEGGKGITAKHAKIPEKSIIVWKIEGAQKHRREVAVTSDVRSRQVHELRFTIGPGEEVSVEVE